MSSPDSTTLRRLVRRSFRPACFALVGASGMCVDLSTYALLLWVLPVGVARALAIWIAMGWNFTLNRRFTFASAERTGVLRQYLSYCAACLLGACVNWSVSLAVTAAVESLPYGKMLAAVAGVLAGTAFNYVLCSRAVFRSRRPAAGGELDRVALSCPASARAPESARRKASRRTVAARSG